MSPEPLAELATHIADGRPIDWTRIESMSPVLAPAHVLHARIVERIAQAYSSLPPAASFSWSLQDSLLAPGPPGGDPTGDTPITWGPLVILEKIGRGTYGSVYRARDPRLDRPVALKLLHRRERDDEGLERAVIEEGRLAARVRHPNVVAVYGAERIEGRVGLWMELVDGRTLEEEVRARGPLPPREVAAIGIDVCRALEAVHRAGLLHRDIKAQNVMRDRDGRVVITDFGAGRELAHAAAGCELAGTPLYLAPEVLEGQAASPRSDVYSLGVLLYHLSTGGFPVTARSLGELRSEHGRLSSLSARARVESVPVPLRAVLAQALDIDPSKRHAGAAQLEAHLAAALARPLWRRRRTWGAATVLLAVLAAGLGARWIGPIAGTPQRSDPFAGMNATRRVVAVLPFENASGDPSQDYVAAGVAAEIQRELSKFGELRVISHAVTSYSAANVRRLATELQAGSVITGSIRIDGEQARVAVRLIDPATAQTLWSQEYDRPMKHAAALQSEVALRVADLLNIGISPDERRRVEKPPTTNATAYGLYLRAGMLPCGDAKATELFRQALELDRNFAVARAAMAYNHLCQSPGRESIQLAVEQAREAIRSDPQVASAHMTLASAYTGQGRASDARVSYLRALALDPNNVFAMSNFAELETAMGRFDEALLWASRAFPLGSSNAYAYFHVGQPLVQLDHDDVSRRWLEEGVRRFPTNPRLHALLAVLDARRGETATSVDRVRRLAAMYPRFPGSEWFYAFDTPDAEVETERSFRRSPDMQDFWFVPESPRIRYADLLMRRGERARANQLLTEALADAEKRLESGEQFPRVPLEIAAVHALRNDTASALDWLERAYDAGWRDGRSLVLDRALESIRPHLRFKALVQRMAADVAAMRERANLAQTLPTPPPAQTTAVRQ